MKVDKKETPQQSVTEVKTEADKAFTADDLHKVWGAFAEQRKKYQAEYNLLTQPFELRDTQITIYLHNPVQEIMLGNIRAELSAYLREKLRNNSISLVGKLQEQADKKVIYTNREKFDYLVDKNPMLKELKDRLGLDTDF